MFQRNPRFRSTRHLRPIFVRIRLSDQKNENRGPAQLDDDGRRHHLEGALRQGARLHRRSRKRRGKNRLRRKKGNS